MATPPSAMEQWGFEARDNFTASALNIYKSSQEYRPGAISIDDAAKALPAAQLLPPRELLIVRQPPSNAIVLYNSARGFCGNRLPPWEQFKNNVTVNLRTTSKLEFNGLEWLVIEEYHRRFEQAVQRIQHHADSTFSSYTVAREAVDEMKKTAYFDEHLCLSCIFPIINPPISLPNNVPQQLAQHPMVLGPENNSNDHHQQSALFGQDVDAPFCESRALVLGTATKHKEDDYNATSPSSSGMALGRNPPTPYYTPEQYSNKRSHRHALWLQKVEKEEALRKARDTELNKVIDPVTHETYYAAQEVLSDSAEESQRRRRKAQTPYRYVPGLPGPARFVSRAGGLVDSSPATFTGERRNHMVPGGQQAKKQQSDAKVLHARPQQLTVPSRTVPSEILCQEPIPPSPLSCQESIPPSPPSCRKPIPSRPLSCSLVEIFSPVLPEDENRLNRRRRSSANWEVSGDLDLANLEGLPISDADYDIGSMLGEGGFGTVYFAQDKHDQSTVALKKIYKSEFKGSEHMVRREIECQSHLDHRNILKLAAYYHDKETFTFVLELAPGGDLYRRINQGPVDAKTSARIISELVDALRHCHSKNIIHRDIKPENVLLDEKETVKVADFGWAVHNPNSALRRTMAGSPEYLAPEIVRLYTQGSEGYDQRVDVWSVGILLFELCTQKSPFADEEDNGDDKYNKLYQRILNHTAECVFLEGKDIDEHASELIRSFLKPSADDRIPLEQVEKSAFIQLYYPRS